MNKQNLLDTLRQIVGAKYVMTDQPKPNATAQDIVLVRGMQ